MKVGYSKGFATFMLVTAVLLTVMNLFLVRSAADLIRFIPAGICLLVGIGYVTRPWFELKGDSFVLMAVFGPAKKVHTFGDISEVRIEGGKVWVGKKKTGATRWLADKRGWADFERHLAERRAASALE